MARAGRRKRAAASGKLEATAATAVNAVASS
jgi:hypothetical protein